MGPLYNPASIARVLGRAIACEGYNEADVVTDAAGSAHILDFAHRYHHTDSHYLLEVVNREFEAFTAAFREASVVMVTFGTAWCFRYDAGGYIAGNCHKLPATEFTRSLLSVDDITRLWQPLITTLQHEGKRLIFTVSPIRHLADGLHGNQLSKATLLLAVERLGSEYFPAYEIMLDDLRDYRFYAADMVHPSDLAVDYIYEAFASTYFSDQTNQTAKGARRMSRSQAHRPFSGI